MKNNLKFLAIAAISATTLFSSCNSDDDTTTTATAIDTHTGVVMGAQNNAVGSYYASASGNVYLSADANTRVSDIDFSYAALGSAADPTLLSWDFRDDASTGLTATVPNGARKCYFKASSVTATQFLQIANGDDANFKTISVSTSSPESIKVATNGVYEFLTVGGRKGLIHVQTISPGVSGSITINVKNTQ